jgi:hypothetical protein
MLVAFILWRMTLRPAPSEDRVVFTDAAIAASTVVPYEPESAPESARPVSSTK